MREIKFRVFWKHKKEMDYNPYADEYICEGTPINDVFTGWPFNKGDAVLMQFTGKYDCERKPIYEGDIIEFDRDEWGGDNNIHTVEWDEHNAEWDWGGGCTGDMDWRTVIGNIYENPELLNDK